MYGALHMNSDVDRLCLKRKGGRGLTSVEHCVREEENSLGFYVAKSEENLIKGVAAAEIINTEDIVISGEIKKQKAQELNKTGMKKKHAWTKMLLCASQEQTIRTNYVKHHIDKSSKSPLCRLCGKNDESV